MEDGGVADVFDLVVACVWEIAGVDNGFGVGVPDINVFDIELHHKVFRPVLVVIILEPKSSPAEPAVNVAIPSVSDLKPKCSIETLR